MSMKNESSFNQLKIAEAGADYSSKRIWGTFKENLVMSQNSANKIQKISCKLNT